MNTKSYKWLLHKVQFETKDAITISFNTSGQPFHFKAGQFINISLYINGEKITRSYSLSSSPRDEYPAITVKRIPNGIMSNFLFTHAHSIVEWEVEGPYGNFVLNKEATGQKEIILLGGGSGITPLYSMLSHIADNSVTPICLIYANRNPEDIIFRTTIREWETSGKMKVIHALTGGNIPDSFSADLIKGRLNRLIVKKLVKQITEDPLKASYFICGPKQLMTIYKEALTAIGIPEEQIFSEHFDLKEDKKELLLPTEPHEVLMHVYESAETEADETTELVQVTSLITVQAGQSILEAAIENGLPVKHSCKTGTCGTCWARYTNGSIQMIKNYALTAEEVEQNYILLCQSYPLNDTVTIEMG